MTKKRFTLNVDGETINDGDNRYCGEDVVELLNELHEKNKELRLQLNLCSDQRNEFHRGVRENVNRVGKLEKENEQLKNNIKEAYNNERTMIGKSVLKQLMETIQ